jgi:hypothetical protein
MENLEFRVKMVFFIAFSPEDFENYWKIVNFDQKWRFIAFLKGLLINFGKMCECVGTTP